ncbi:MAG: DUF4113 domain-containing protein [Azoarcus sp.]|nr:DUF4113 domain-containing protein [Azoarcus sp.]
MDAINRHFGREAVGLAASS